MSYTIQWLRSLVFNLQMYIAMPIFGLVYLPWMIISPHGAVAACKAFSRYVMWTASWMVGLKCERRGTPPTEQVLVAAKHQSFLDIMMIFEALPHGKFIMKREILYTPIIGAFAYRLGSIPVDRGKRGKAISKMLSDVEKGHQLPGQIVIYSQGTRVPPGKKMPYKVGSGALYEQLEWDCVPVSTNAGVFWPKRGIYRKPGTAVVEFLPEIKTGMERDAFLELLEDRVESASDALLVEAGFVPES